MVDDHSRRSRDGENVWGLGGDGSADCHRVGRRTVCRNADQRPVLDHLGTRSALVAGPALGCAAGLIAAGVPYFGPILALVFFMGVAESIWVIAREVSGIDLASPSQRGRVLSGFHGVNNVGLALGPLFGGLLTESVGFRAAFVGSTICAAASVLIGFAVRNRKEKEDEDSPQRRGGRRRFYLIFLCARGASTVK